VATLLSSITYKIGGLALNPVGANGKFRVHIAFGFHVNPYHSFRSDTNDENGYGQDAADGRL
jgi:hypothetical protein